MSNKKLHIIYVVEDGITTLCCGVGTIAHHFVCAFHEIAEKSLIHGIKLRLSIITLAASSSSVGVRADLREQAQVTCTAFQGKLYLIEPVVNSNFEYFDFSVWEKYNEQANDIIVNISKNTEDAILVIANDTIFAKTRYVNSNVVNVWIPHSLSSVHAQSYVDNIKRLGWESQEVQTIQKSPNCYIGYISQFAKLEIERTFSLGEGCLVPCLNGFYFPNIQKYEKSQIEIESMLKQRGIPTDREIIFSFGRADEYKGLDIALRVMILAAEKYDYQGVLIASIFSQEAVVSSVQEQLKNLSKKHNSDVLLFFSYEFELPKYILQYMKTKFLLNLSIRDFAPLIPYEAELLGHSDLCIINSDIECFRSTMSNGQNGFLCPPIDIEALSAIENVRLMTKNSKQDIIYHCKKTALVEKNIVNNYCQLIFLLIDQYP